MKNQIITLRLEKDLREQLELIALEENSTLSKVIRVQLEKSIVPITSLETKNSFINNPHFRIAISCMYFIATKKTTVIERINLNVLKHCVNEVLSFDDLPDYLIQDFEDLKALFHNCFTNGIALHHVNLDNYPITTDAVFRYIFNISTQNITETILLP